MPEVIFTQAARAEVLEARDWYNAVGGDLGDRFCQELDQTIEQLRKNPQAFGAVFRDVRRILLRGFPYALFYRVIPQGIVVIACFHASRNPRRWQER